MLERIPNRPPKIEPLLDNLNRPLWSVMIPSYNCIHYLREAINSVLIQALTVEEMQIEVIDDFSIDGDVEALVNEIGEGRVGFFKQPMNVGHLRNFETCINRAKGKLVHILHGDDTVNPGFYQEISSLFKEYPAIGAAFTNGNSVDENNKFLWNTPQIGEKAGIIKDWLLKAAEKTQLETPCMVVKRSVYEDLGSFFGVQSCEDWLMWVRIAARYEVAYSPKPLANYRVHTNNLTGDAFSTGQNFKDVKKAIGLIQEHLPKHKKKFLRHKARHSYATYISSTIPDQLYHQNNDSAAAMTQAMGVFKFYPNLNTFHCLVKISTKVLFGYKRKLS